MSEQDGLRRLSGDFDEILQHLEGHNCTDTEDHYHSITHVLDGVGAPLERAMRSIDTAAKTADCTYSSLRDLQTEKDGPTARTEVYVLGRLADLKRYITELKGLVSAGRS